MVVLFADPLFQRHQTGAHPENAGRLQAIDQLLASHSDSGVWTNGTIVPATPAQLTTVHPESYLQSLREMSESGGGRLDPDTLASPQSFDVARHAAGTACEAVRQVLEGHSQRALCLTRPPGHHALVDRAMGFCLLANISIAARFAQQLGIERVLIVDWDVHHGNGTQAIFYDDPRVMFFSSHRYPFYPGSGAEEETGTGAGLGTTFNLPIEYGTSRREILKQFEVKLQQAAEKARPELILISAGFDAHRLDPIGSLDLETEDFQQLTEMVKVVAQTWCAGRIVSILEGGYHPQALAESVWTHLQSLAKP